MAVPTVTDPYPSREEGRGGEGRLGEVWNIKEFILIRHTHTPFLSHTVSVFFSLS